MIKQPHNKKRKYSKDDRLKTINNEGNESEYTFSESDNSTISIGIRRK